MVSRPELVARTIAICTPFAGSRYAKWAPLPALRAFAAANPTTRALATNVAANSRITSIYGTFDPIIPEGSKLDGARNVQLRVAGHFRILGSEELLSAVEQAVATGLGE